MSEERETLMKLGLWSVSAAVAALLMGAWATPAQATTYGYTEAGAMISLYGLDGTNIVPGPGGSLSEPSSLGTANSLGSVVATSDMPGSGLSANALPTFSGMPTTYADNSFIPTGAAGDFAIGDSQINGFMAPTGPRFFLDTFAEAGQTGLGSSSAEGIAEITIYFDVLAGTPQTVGYDGTWSGSDAATATGANESAGGGTNLYINIYEISDPTSWTLVWTGSTFSMNIAEGLPGAPGASSNTYGPSGIYDQITLGAGHYAIDIIMHSQFYLTSKNIPNTPEPTSLTLLSLGAAGLLARARRS